MKHFFRDSRLYRALEEEFDFAIIWLGSNDIDENCQVRDIVKGLEEIVEAVKTRCKAKVKLCKVEPRWTDGTNRYRVSQETYDKVARGVNRLLYRRFKKDKLLCFGAKPFTASLKRDGVHFNEDGRREVNRKLVSCIESEEYRRKVVKALGGPWKD